MSSSTKSSNSLENNSSSIIQLSTDEKEVPTIPPKKAPRTKTGIQSIDFSGKISTSSKASTSRSSSSSSSNNNNKGIRLSRMPSNVRANIKKFDDNNDGFIGTNELIRVIDDLKGTKQDNKMLRNLVIGLAVFALLLISCIFAASIVAARLSKDTNVDPLTGIAYVKDNNNNNNDNSHHYGSVMKTEDVVIYSDNMDIVGMSNEELKVLKQIILDSGNVKFDVKGYGRSNDGSQIHLIVEGGSLITWDSEGIVNATGLAEIILDSAFPARNENDNENENEVVRRRRRRRWLSGGCGDGGSSGGGASNSNRSF